MGNGGSRIKSVISEGGVDFEGTPMNIMHFMERNVKTYDILTGRCHDSIIVVSHQRGRKYLLTYTCDGVTLSGESDFPFEALGAVREQLKKKKMILLCKGARKDVHPSGMSLSTLLAYKLTFGKPGGKEDLVNIFDPEDDTDAIADVAEQTEYYRRWIESLGKV